MANRNDEIENLVSNPTESLAVELKTWINPKTPEGIAKIAKGCLAMRNNNGGYLIIGFDNRTCLPDSNRPPNVRNSYHPDVIQGIVSKYASEKFEVEVKYVNRDDNEFPVVCVPNGVRTPAASKSNLQDSAGKFLIKENCVYVRSLNSNNTVSTTEATYRDWESLVSRCIDNREADIGRFVRRHFNNLDALKLQELLATLQPSQSPSSSISHERESTRSQKILALMDSGVMRYNQLVDERKLSLPDHGAFEAGIAIFGDIPAHTANKSFLNLMLSSNPRFTGWPFWIDTQHISQGDCRPYHFEGRWEAFIALLGNGLMDHLDFWQIYPSAQFYHRRYLEDDSLTPIGDNPLRIMPPPLTALDFSLPVWRVGEVLATGLRFGRALECIPEGTTLRFGFRWTRLRGRTLSNWASRDRHILPRESHQDTVTSEVEIPLETADSALFQYVHMATQPLFQIFDGFDLSPKIIEEIVSKMLKRTN